MEKLICLDKNFRNFNVRSEVGSDINAHTDVEVKLQSCTISVVGFFTQVLETFDDRPTA